MRKEGWREEEGKAYYPSFSALNYLNANDVRGRKRGGQQENDAGWKTLRGNGEENTDMSAADGGSVVEGANVLLLGVSRSSLVIQKAGYTGGESVLTFNPEGQSN